MPNKLSGKRALVTGAGTGIGRAIALEFARQGAAVALHYASSREGAYSAAAAIAALGGTAHCLQADLREVPACLSLVDQAADALGGLDILVNNAGLTEEVWFLEATPEHFDRLYQVNIRGQFFCAQQAARRMLAGDGGGVIINLCSVHGFAGAPRHSVYAGTKGAIIAFTRELGVELAPMGIRVNGLAPGWTEVEGHWARYEGYDPVAGGRSIPARRVGQPEDIARVAAFLASGDAAYIVGQTLLVDGGMVAALALGNSSADKDR